MKMELCSHGHDEICHDSRRCPVCELLDEIKEMKLRLDDLRDENRQLTQELEEYDGN